MCSLLFDDSIEWFVCDICVIHGAACARWKSARTATTLVINRFFRSLLHGSNVAGL
jgi:hypothetical protein